MIYYSALQYACKSHRQRAPSKKKYTIPMSNDVHKQFYYVDNVIRGKVHVLPSCNKKGKKIKREKEKEI